ncbi:S8 family peptidase [Burkholderia sp. Z1]|uniref:S8 family peptidase n=1 Tax=Burkholderia sp. Z1 TaxID=2759039 RepID=UPI0018673326
MAVVSTLTGCGGGDGGGGQPPNVSTVPPAVVGGTSNKPTPPATTTDNTDCSTSGTKVATAPSSSTGGQGAAGVIVRLSPFETVALAGRAMAAVTPERRIAAVIDRVAAATGKQGAGGRIFAAVDGADRPHIERMLSASTALVAFDRIIPAAKLEALVEAYAADPDVAGAEADEMMNVRSVPTDPDYAQQWNLSSPTVGINLPAAWDITTGAPTVVTAVLDTGYVPHADLVTNLLPGYDFLTSIAIGNNGHARGPDAIDPGNWVTREEAADRSSRFYNCDPRASTWHGTKVAGLIGATANNGMGIAGVNWYGKILPVRVLGKCGGPTSDVIDGLRWAAGIDVPGAPANPTPAKVINLSLGGKGRCGDEMQRAIDDVVARGTTVVVAAGNEGNQFGLDRPANCRGVIAVGSTDNTGRRAWDSNFGADVLLSAPGANVLSTSNTGSTSPQKDTVSADSGTSMAAPQVTGVVSLMLTVNPTLTPRRIAEILKQTARPAVGGAVQSCRARPAGAGILDAAAAVAAAARD